MSTSSCWEIQVRVLALWQCQISRVGAITNYRFNEERDWFKSELNTCQDQIGHLDLGRAVDHSITILKLDSLS